MSNRTVPDEGLPCPVCKVALVLSWRQSVEIDFCPKCRGVWLDRGELDKLIAMGAAYEAGVPLEDSEGRRMRSGFGQPWDGGHSDRRRDDHDGRHVGGHSGGGHGGGHGAVGHGRRRGFLSGFFDL